MKTDVIWCVFVCVLFIHIALGILNSIDTWITMYTSLLSSSVEPQLIALKNTVFIP